MQKLLFVSLVALVTLTSIAFAQESNDPKLPKKCTHLLRSRSAENSRKAAPAYYFDKSPRRRGRTHSEDGSDGRSGGAYYDDADNFRNAEEAALWDLSQDELNSKE